MLCTCRPSCPQTRSPNLSICCLSLLWKTSSTWWLVPYFHGWGDEKDYSFGCSWISDSFKNEIFLIKWLLVWISVSKVIRSTRYTTYIYRSLCYPRAHSMALWYPHDHDGGLMLRGCVLCFSKSGRPPSCLLLVFDRRSHAWDPAWDPIMHHACMYGMIQR